jgi:deaminated glutathione amidase
VAAAYRKIHMFDVDVGGVAYRESAATAPGDEVVVAEALGHRIGLSVCYDLRFPELYRRLVDDGAEIITVPAAFTAVTGRDHWEPLLRARAIENQTFVIAAGQHGRLDDGTDTHGRSMVVDPWGLVLAQAADGEGLAVADLDFARLDEIRARLPALRHRRPDAYGGRGREAR